MANSLSPAAQEIWVAYLEHSEADETPADLPALAAALRAVADQVERKWQGFAHEACREIRAIASELEGGGTNTSGAH